MIKVSIENNKIKHSVEVPMKADLDIGEMLENLIIPLLESYGYAHQSIREFISYDTEQYRLETPEDEEAE